MVRTHVSGSCAPRLAGPRHAPRLCIAKVDFAGLQPALSAGRTVWGTTHRMLAYNHTPLPRSPVGFTCGFDALWPHVLGALESEVAANGSAITSVTFAGHSQGAAIASMLAYAVGRDDARSHSLEVERDLHTWPVCAG